MKEDDRKKANEVFNMIIDGKIKLINNFIENLDALKNVVVKKCEIGEGVILMNTKDWNTVMSEVIKSFENMKKMIVGEYK